MTSSTTTKTPIPQLYPGIKTIPGSVHHKGFTQNILEYIPKPWETLRKVLMCYSLIYPIIPSPSKECSIALIPNGFTIDRRDTSLINESEVFFTLYIGRNISDDFEKIDSLPYYTNAYSQGKFLDDLTLSHILILEDTNQSTHYIVTIIVLYSTLST